MKRVLSLLLAAVMLFSLAACGGSSEAGVKITNDLGYELVELYVTLSSKDFWGDDLLPAAAEDGSVTVFLSGYEPAEGDTFDLRAVDVDGYVYEFYDLNLVDGDAVEMAWSEESAMVIITPVEGDAFTVGGTVIEPEGAGIDEEFLGCWKYDDYDMYIVLYEDMTWQLLDNTGFSYINHAFEYEENLVYLLEESGSVYLTLTFEEGVLTDSDGDTLYPAPWPTGEEEGSGELPSIDDELTEYVELPGSDGEVVWYPELMNVESESSMLRFTAVNREDTDDYYSSISIQLVPVSGYDDAMSQGYDSAKAKLAEMMDQVLEATFGGLVTQSIGSDFKDHGNYFTYDEYVWLDSSIYSPAPDEPVRAALQIRYLGPTGYVLVMNSMALDRRIATYYAIGKEMVDSIGLEGDWSTAPKPKPTTGGSGGAWSDTGDYGTAYYWYDEDGDVWYWNGYEDIFIGFGDDYYIEDGQYYESNDAGWDDDYYYDDYYWSGDYGDTYDDYYWSGDYGDTYDDYYWSGDYGDTYDDYYWSGDYGDTYDYYY